MAYPERKPIYEAYEAIVKSIIEKQQYKEYALSEIEALDKELQSQLKMIAMKLVSIKYKSR